MELEAGSSSNMHQVSYLEESVGRMVKSSKVRITWEFVSSDGREHKIVLAWSRTTGKQQIQMDGTEVWFGQNHGRSVLDHNWTTRDESLKIHVLGTCAPPMNENFRSYDLVINGQLFVTLPHCGPGGSTFTPVPPPIRNDNLNSIIQILYPNGYAPPPDKYQLQQQKQKQRKEKLRRKKLCGIDVVFPQRHDSMLTPPTIALQSPHQNTTTINDDVSSELVPLTKSDRVVYQRMIDLLIW